MKAQNVSTLAVCVTMVVLIALAYAGAPPAELLPWRACEVVDTVGNAVVIDTVWYLTREDYLSEVLGQDAKASAIATNRKLKKIEALLRARSKGDR